MTHLDKFIKDTLQYYLRGIKFCLSAMLRYWYVTVLFAIVLGYVVYTKSIYKSYTGDMVYVHNYLDENYYARQLEELKAKLGTPSFSEALYLDANTANKILNIEVKDLRGNALIDKKNDESTPIYIYFTFSEKLNTKEVEDAFTAYFNNNPLIKKTIQENKNLNVSKLAFLEKELGILDSIKRNSYAQNTNIQILNLNYAALFTETEKKFNEIVDLKNSSIKEESIEVFRPLSIQEKSESMFKVMLKFGILWIILSVFFSTLLAVLNLGKKV